MLPFFRVNTGKTNRGLNRGLPEEIAVNYEGAHTAPGLTIFARRKNHKT